MSITLAQPQRIAIIGAGFSGTALAAALHRAGEVSCEIMLFDKSGRFGMGDAYRTPFPFHWLNVRACDMSAFEDEPDHYVKWLEANQEIKPYLDKNVPLPNQFTPRILYGTYLKKLLQDIQEDKTGKIKLCLESAEVIDVGVCGKKTILTLKDDRQVSVDKVVFAMGNHVIKHFPFPVSMEMKCIRQPWDYLAPSRIKVDEPVMIVGTGLTMIDTVLTLYHQGHRGKIYAVSRHGLLPLPHADNAVPFVFFPEDVATDVRLLTKFLRYQSRVHSEAGGDWRSIINAVRKHVPVIWSKISARDKKRFIRHLVPYWNIHRHRVHPQVATFLQELILKKQLIVIAGHIQSVDNKDANVKLRKTQEIRQIPISWLINCMGPANDISTAHNTLLNALVKKRLVAIDELKLGFDITAKASSSFYTVGFSHRGVTWEASAVPEIRKQLFDLTKHLLEKK